MTTGFRFIRILFMLAFVLFSFASPGDCRQQCPDDDDQGRCAPLCAQCACCPHPGPVIATPAAVAPVPPTAPAVRSGLERIPGSRFRPEIFHVPRFVLVQT